MYDTGKNLTNMALGKSATQSSLSRWSSEGEAAAAVSGVMPSDFAFHTAYEQHPWWMVDLGGIFPIETIIVHNRVGLLQERAARLRVEIGPIPGEWALVHAGFALFGARGRGRPLELHLGGHLEGRYVRLSLDSKESLHLAQVEVLVSPKALAVSAFCHKFGLERLRSRATQSPYAFEQNAQSRHHDVVGLRIDYKGRFGNLLHQYINAILIARRTCLRYVQLQRHELLDVRAPFVEEGITFLPVDSSLPINGIFLTGEFFNADDFVPLLGPFLRFTAEAEREITAIVQTIIVPHMLTRVPLPDERHFDDEVTIHIRSGDIFEADHPVVYGYRQPPLSFYVLVIERMMREGLVTRVRLVFQDRGNPCVDALCAWLDERAIPTREQCGSLHEDVSALVDAPHLVFGHGTFGYAAARLSRRVRTLHFFAPQLGGSYGDIPTIERVFEVTDIAGRYIKAFEYGKPFGPNEGWRNTPEMRATMLDYPIEALEVREITTPTGA